MAKKVNKVVLAYSGGLDTSVIVPWLKETYGCKVIACVVDVGQKDDFKATEKKAIASGADKVYVLDKKEEFMKEYVFPMIKSGGVYEGKYLLGTSIARPIIAKAQVEIALKEGADAVSHGATGKGNDQVRFELTYKALAPQLKIIAAWKDDNWTIRSRSEAIDYAKAHGVPVPVTKKKPYSEDDNLWHISHEGGILEDPAKECPEEVLSRIATIKKAAETPQYVTINFVKGIPVGINGKKMEPVALITKLNELGGKHGIGFVDMVENRLVGIKSRGVYETPGGTLLFAAHKELEEITMDRDTAHYKQQLELKFTELIYNGMWFAPLREAISAFIDKTQETVTGDVKLKLYKGHVIPAGKTSPNSLYSMAYATFEEDEVYSQKDATGFINLFGLQLKIFNQVNRKKK
ncbi:MAG: argininosuccinate synthase [Candidatus Goldbacteria bacterium]|nr:argininosuccinate synthase [Candidatus Goldiibacteriota bacterium]